MPGNPTLPDDVRAAVLKEARMVVRRKNARNRPFEAAIDAVAPLIIEWALGEAVDWARSCSGESADVAADYIEDMRAQGVKATSATAPAFNMQDVARMAGLPTPDEKARASDG